MFETIKDVGSILGIVTFVFTVYDRLLNARPILSLAILPYLNEKRPYIRVRNVAKHEIFVKSIEVNPNYVFLVVRSDDIEELLRAYLKDHEYLVISSSEEVNFLLFALSSQIEAFDKSRHKIYVKVIWRKTRSSWCPQIPLRMTIDAQEYKKLLGDSSAYHSSSTNGWIPD